MTRLPTINDWLASLNHDRLTAVMEVSPLALAGARLRDLDELAGRLSHPANVYQVLRAVPLPVLEVAELASALGHSATPATIAELLDDSGSADLDTHLAQVAHWLDTAEQASLLWTDDERVRVNPGFDEVILRPLALGRPARMILGELTTDGLAALLKSRRVTAPPRKAERLTAASRLFCDLAAIRRTASNAPDAVLADLSDHVSRQTARARCVAALHGSHENPYVNDDDAAYLTAAGGRFDRDAYRRRQERNKWAESAGLAFAPRYFGYGYNPEIPTEVYLALAPVTFRAPFHPIPTPLSVSALASERLEQGSGAALGQLLGSAMAVFEAVGRDGAAVLKKGGVGTRELAKLAKQVGLDTATVRLVLELGGALGLFALGAPGRMGASEEFQQWRRRPPHERALQMVTTWMTFSFIPTAEHDETGSALPALGTRARDTEIPAGLVLAATLEPHADAGAVSVADVAGQLAWNHPTAGLDDEMLAHTWAEAHLLGVLVDGALAPFARPLCHGDEQQAAEKLAEVMPGESTQVLFGSDLTIVIPGDPAPDVVDVLDAVAGREGHGVANTWRVSESSVRDALDAGYPIDELTGALEAIADGPLPQAMAYLLRDTARKHGHLGVRPATVVIVCDDEALLAEVTGAKKLAKLGVNLVAPTVAIAGKPVGEVLRRLRAAGYLPVEADSAGGRVVQLQTLPRIRSRGDAANADDGAAEGAANDEVVASGGASASDDASGSGTVDGHDTGSNVLSLDAARARRDMPPGSPDGSDPAQPPEPPLPRGPQPPSPSEVATRLLDHSADPYAGDVVADLAEVERMIANYNRQLSPSEIHELADAEVSVRPVQLRYRSSSGGETVRTVSRLNLVGSDLFGYCHLREAQRMFRLDRIVEVLPALW